MCETMSQILINPATKTSDEEEDDSRTGELACKRVGCGGNGSGNSKAGAGTGWFATLELDGKTTASYSGRCRKWMALEGILKLGLMKEVQAHISHVAGNGDPMI